MSEICGVGRARVKLMKNKQMRTVVMGYLRKSGYLTGGFVGDGPLKIEFIERKKNDPSVVVGVRESSGGSSPKHEVVVVKIDEGAKCEPDFIIAPADCGDDLSANKCFLAMPIKFAEEDKKIAKQFNIGLLEIHGDKVKEVIRAKLMTSRVMTFPRSRFDGLKLAQQLLKFSQKDLEHLARVFCRAEVAFLMFNVGDVLVEFRKERGLLEVKIATLAGPLRRSGTYLLKFGEFVSSFVNPSSDRYTFVDKLGDMFVFRPEEWRFLLRALSKVEMCHLTFFVGTAKADFFKHPGMEGLDLSMEIRNEPPHADGYQEYHYSQDYLGMLTKKKRRKEKQAITSSEGS